MTNNWTDIGNATCIISIGANPAENHPACMAHMNRAREELTLTDAQGAYKLLPSRDASGNQIKSRKRRARLIVIDPRKTRTARQIDEAYGDRYIRVRPGTDIAFINGVVNWIINNIAGAEKLNFEAFLDYKGDRTFTDDEGKDVKVTDASKFTDARMLVKSDGTDYDRETRTVGTQTIASFPKYAATYKDAGTVFDRLKKHVSFYNAADVAKICGCQEGDIAYVGQAFVENSRFASATTVADEVYTIPLDDAAVSPASPVAFQLYASFLDPASVSVKLEDGTACDLNVDYKLDALNGTITRIAGGKIAASTDTVKVKVKVSYSGMTNDPKSKDFRSTTMLYAMGLTQHTYGAQNCKALAVVQTLMGNMGRCGGGINALRGIHNVQGSTDMGLLFGNIPAYSGNPKSAPYGHSDATLNDAQAYGKYMDKLYGVRLSDGTATTKFDFAAVNSDVTFVAKKMGAVGNGLASISFVDPGANSAALAVSVSGADITISLATDAGGAIASTAKSVVAAVNGHAVAKTLVAASFEGDGSGLVAAAAAQALAGGSDNDYADAYTPARMGLQQRGFYNMSREWFGRIAVTGGKVDRAAMDAIYSLWPKTDGYDHITMFRRMALNTPDRISAALVWGQNPAVTEPNQGAVRAGLKNLDTLVVVDNYETETAAVDRKDGSWTYLLPACSYIEEPGSVVNSGRVLQWRYEAVEPKGNSKRDIELLLRLAKKLDEKGAFSHIENTWTGVNVGWTKVAADPAANQFVSVYDHLWGIPTGYDGLSAMDKAKAADVCEKLYIQMCSTVANGGTMWIYQGAYTPADPYTGKWAGGYTMANRAKQRNNADATGNLLYPNWGFSWLANRRVLYNNGEVIGDVADGFQGPDQCSRLYVSKNSGTIDYAKNYRSIHLLKDKPDTATGAGERHEFGGRFPAHTEPYETNKTDIVAVWGRNTKDDGTTTPSTPFNLVKGDTKVAGRGHTIAGGKLVDDPPVSEFPLILTTIRCVEHFQGGPTTRNNPWNVEVEPEPWIEINSLDAIKYNIKAGDWVNVITARSNSTSNQLAITRYTRDASNTTDNFGRGFKARIQAGVQANQRVAPGVVAIPWHWGDRGLSTGARANDLCIDAVDANSAIPEYKACLCKIVKA